MIRSNIVMAIGLALLAVLSAAPAQAQRDRVFVASYGSDSNPCTFGSPCKTFQNAVNVVAQGGEVTAIDSAGFGTFTISHAVTITSPNGVEAGIAAPASGDAAITINAQSGDVVRLNGLTLDGADVSGTKGIMFNSGGGLEVRNSVIRNFASGGILLYPSLSTSSQLLVSNTLISDNGGQGIFIDPTGSGATNVVLDHVTIENNTSSGLTLQTYTQTITVTVSDSVIANNGSHGFSVGSSAGGPLNVMVRDTTIATNGQDGLEADGTGVTIRVTRSTITGNTTAWVAESGGVVSSYADNNIDGNGGANSTPPNPLPYH